MDNFALIKAARGHALPIHTEAHQLVASMADALEASDAATAAAIAVGKAATVEDLILLPIGAVLRGPDWHEEVYKKAGDVEFYAIASQKVWLASNLEPRGPFDVLYMPKDAE